MNTQDKIIMITGIAGNIAGWTYAFQNKKSFWGYVGYGLLGGLVIGGVGTIIAIATTKNTTA